MKYTIVLAFIWSVLSLAEAATVTIASGLGSVQGITVKTAEGAILSGGGYYIAVGSFDIVPTISGGTMDLSPYVDAMNIFATMTSPTATGYHQGAIYGTLISISNPTLFNSRQIYIVVGNGASRATSTEFAILTSATNILFPGDVTSVALTTIQLFSIANSVVLPNAGTEIEGGAARDMIQLVPEPSAVLLGLLGVPGLLRRRR